MGGRAKLYSPSKSALSSSSEYEMRSCTHTYTQTTHRKTSTATYTYTDTELVEVCGRACVHSNWASHNLSTNGRGCQCVCTKVWRVLLRPQSPILSCSEQSGHATHLTMHAYERALAPEVGVHWVCDATPVLTTLKTLTAPKASHRQGTHSCMSATTGSSSSSSSSSSSITSSSSSGRSSRSESTYVPV